MMVTTSQPFPGGLYVADPTCRSTLMMNPDHRARLIMSNCIDKILLQLFRGISKDLASFIQRLVKVDPAERLTARQAMDDPWVTNGGAESKWYSAMPLLSAEDVLSKPMPSKISVNTLSEVIDHGNANCKMDETTPVAVAKCEVRSDTATPLTCR
jgi:serine/threonine protein kinase